MKINIATDYSTAPGPRHRTEGRNSGEEFRERLLLPAIREAMQSEETLTVELDGTAGFGTSFLEEAFGGLIRNDGIALAQLRSVLKVVSVEEPDLIREIEEYLADAESQREPK